MKKNLYCLETAGMKCYKFKSRKMRRGTRMPRMGDSRNTYRVLVGKNEGKRPTGKPNSFNIHDISTVFCILEAILSIFILTMQLQR